MKRLLWLFPFCIALLSLGGCFHLGHEDSSQDQETNQTTLQTKPESNCSHPAPSNFPFTPGTSYFGNNNYIEYIPGTLPIIISAPHGGELAPQGIAIYRDGLTNDGGSQNYARAVAQTLLNLSGKSPHLIINHLTSNRLNLNFAPQDDNQNPLAQQAWQEFHDFINSAKNWISLACEKGLLFDVHTNGHDHGYNELGYLLTRDELNLSDEEINQLSSRSSMYHLASQEGNSLADILHGPFSLGELMRADHQLPTIPNILDVPFQHAYFNGGYNTRTHGSINGGVIDAIQIESHFNFVNSGQSNRLEYSQQLGHAIFKYIEHWYGFELNNL